MKTETYRIAKGQFLANIEPFASKGLPTDSIIHKQITGCGATTLEILFPRNSIIIEPNVPVILGKCKKLNKGKRGKNKLIIGVYEGIDVPAIKFYIENKSSYKKILTTPEGFVKVAEAIGVSRFTDYFLLFDECEKAIQDVDFRNAIIDPINDFFEFDNKAFVSATPIIPSDPRFNTFKHVYIEPDYDYKEDIMVCTTNNVMFHLKMVLEHLDCSDKDKKRKFFIFYKSTNRIRNIINCLKLNDYAVYCSKDSVKELRRNDISNAYYSINNTFCRYNFLTSRFFSAVDIDYEEYKCDPIIILITDVLAVEHSVIDPATEAIQICGRFRPPVPEDGEPEIVVKKDIVHITNYNSKLTSYKENEVKAILGDKRTLHEFITQFKPTSDIEYFNLFIEEILKLNGFGCFLKNSQLNHFMVDNFINEERVKGYYQNGQSLTVQYRRSKHFNMLLTSAYYKYNLSDKQLLSITDQTKYTSVNDLVSKTVKDIMDSTMSALWQGINLSMLKMIYPEQMLILEQFTLVKARQFEYNINNIQQHLEESSGVRRLMPIIRYIQNTFEKLETRKKGYTSAQIEALLTKGIDETAMTDFKPNIQLLRNAVTLSDRKNIEQDENGKWLKGYKILDFIHKF